ncbi:UPF0182 family protein [Micrococcales bacterium 31B]|nr:UPF0182 family protein [Micrococcales bacterium 31B]
MVVVALAVVVLVASEVWTRVLWFQQLGMFQVLRTEWLTRGILFIMWFVIAAGALWLNLRVAYNARPIFVPMTPEEEAMERYRASVEPLRKLVTYAAPILVGIFTAASVSANWQTVLLFLNRQPFGTTDPQFGFDIGFFVFTLPLVQLVLTTVMAIVVICGICSLITHYLYSSIRIRPGRAEVVKPARIQMGILLALFALLLGANYWFDQYAALTESGARFDGAGYAAVTAMIPAKAILAVVAVIVAVLFLLAALRGWWKLPALAAVLMVVAVVAVGGIYPAAVQRFKVAANEQTLESPYIKLNIDSTKFAYGIDKIEYQTYAAKTTAEEGALREDAATTASIRLLDPQVVTSSFRQLQQNKQYYTFTSPLNVDRYTIEGESRDTVIGVRELNLGGLDAAQQTWVNQHMGYTHGYGVVAAYGNQPTVDGSPLFYQQGIPTEGPLGTYEPRIYFGQNSPDYSIVGAPAGVAPFEIDYPDDTVANGLRLGTYQGDGGPDVGNWVNRLLYAVKFRTEKILLSDNINSESQILYDRDPLQRAEAVAPFLTFDSAVYPAVVDGRVKWILDGYTTTALYPYAQKETLDQAAADSQSERAGAATLRPDQVNYVRNSVKVTVDAFDGKVDLYEWDSTDPILKAWKQVYPDLVQPTTAISSQLMSHLRYPEDLFKIQRTLLGRYHVDDASSFYTGQDAWTASQDPTTPGTTAPQPPYYMTLQMPGQDTSTFSLTGTFIPGGAAGTQTRQVLTGFLAADADAGNVAGKKSENYGTLRLLELPRNVTVQGPLQAYNTLITKPEVSTVINQLKIGNNSQVTYGNLLTLPVGGGLMYVMPVYVQANASSSFPQLQRVIVGFGDKVGFANTLQEALDQVFDGDAGATAGDADLQDVKTDTVPTPAPTGSATPTPSGSATPTPSATPTTSASATAPTPVPGATATSTATTVEQAIAEANAAYVAGETALQQGNFAEYGAQQAKLKAALDKAASLSGNAG